MAKQFKYRALDVSHYQGVINHQQVAQALPNARFAYVKASDGYHMADKAGKFDYGADRHTDAMFLDNFRGFRSVGWAVAPYAFIRWDMPWRANRKDTISSNLKYFKIATEPVAGEFDVAVLDMEQSAHQLEAAGLSRATVTSMAKDIVNQFSDSYKYLLAYTGSYWFDRWITDPEWFSARMGLIEAEYVPIRNNEPAYSWSKPRPAKGWSSTLATSADDLNGKLFAWQYASYAKVEGIKGNADINGLDMPKSEIQIVTGQSLAVDPPPPVPDNGGVVGVLDRLDEFSKDERDALNG